MRHFRCTFKYLNVTFFDNIIKAYYLEPQGGDSCSEQVHIQYFRTWIFMHQNLFTLIILDGSLCTIS